MEIRRIAREAQAGKDPGRPPRDDRDRDAMKVGTPSAVLAIIPYLLGFHPSDSLVVIGAGPPSGRIHLTFRYDLPDPPSRADAAEIAEHAAAILEKTPGVTAAIVAGYGPGRLVTPVAEAIRGKLAAAGIELQELLRAEDGRYWSKLCGVQPDLELCSKARF